MHASTSQSATWKLVPSLATVTQQEDLIRSNYLYVTGTAPAQKTFTGIL